MNHLYILCRFIPTLLLAIFIDSSQAQSLVSLFPLEQYSQSINQWIKPSDPNYNKPLLSMDMQQKRMNIFYSGYFGASSPWNSIYINRILHPSPGPSLKTVEQELIKTFNNTNKTYDKIGYGENFRPYSEKWIDTIANNINIDHLDDLIYQESNRGIAISNLAVRALPTDDVFFHSDQIAGEGYPFDYLQMSSLWAGTPVYILDSTQDHAWDLIVSPAFIGWVKSNGIAKVNVPFINTWVTAARNKLAAITHTQTSLLDAGKKFFLTTYIGAVFPVDMTTLPSQTDLTLLIPVADNQQNAIIKKVLISKKNASVMPLTMTPHHFVDIISTLIGRPYGWGGMYFYNDCSAELKNIFTPFGIWLPRHSSAQITAGKIVDKSMCNPSERLHYLMTKGKPFLTIVYIGGHIFLYIGNDVVPQTQSLAAMTYQNLWGLKPNSPVERAVIGQAVLFPLLLKYPEVPNLTSLAAKKYFQVSYLNELPMTDQKLIQQKSIDIRSLMYPETDEG